jgi:hypothetical protein
MFLILEALKAGLHLMPDETFTPEQLAQQRLDYETYAKKSLEEMIQNAAIRAEAHGNAVQLDAAKVKRFTRRITKESVQPAEVESVIAALEKVIHELRSPAFESELV